MTEHAPLSTDDPRRVGDYELVARLGTGGMGVVFLAHDPEGRPVAVKLVHAELARDAEFRERFRGEVERARQVPPFCTAEVLDADPGADRPWLVVEYVPGPTLAAEVTRRGPLSSANLHSVAIGVATALTAIHDAGVIHRDLKPANVLLAPGSPKVIDFGIARALEPTAARQTRTGQFHGTIGYMAPERFDAPDKPLTPAADVFAWGCVVAYAGTGQAPFDADSPMATFARILTQPPRLDGLPDGPLRTLVAESLASDPAARPTARELLDRLLGSGARTALDTQPELRNAALAAPSSAYPTIPAPLPDPGRTPPPDPAHTPPTDPAHTPPTYPAHTPPTDPAHTPPTDPAHTPPTDPAHTPLADAARTAPSDPARTAPSDAAPASLSDVAAASSGSSPELFRGALPSSTPSSSAAVPPPASPVPPRSAAAPLGAPSSPAASSFGTPSSGAPSSGAPSTPAKPRPWRRVPVVGGGAVLGLAIAVLSGGGFLAYRNSALTPTGAEQPAPPTPAAEPSLPAVVAPPLSSPSTAVPSSAAPPAPRSSAASAPKSPKSTPKKTTRAPDPALAGRPPVKAGGSTAPYGPYFIHNYATNMCVDVDGIGAGTPDQPVLQDVCQPVTDDNQEYQFVPHGKDSGNNQLYWIRNIEDGLCLDVPGAGAVDPATEVSLMTCLESDNQDYRLETRFTAAGRQYYWLINAASTMCLDVYGTGDGGSAARLTLITCTAGDDHEWALVKRSEF